MDLLDLEKMAYAGSEMPDGLNTGEQMFFFAMRGLYHNHHIGAVNRERGHREKQRIMVAYQQVKFQYEMLDEQMKLRRRLELEIGSLHKCDCPTCRQVARVFDGIDRRDVPEDIKEVMDVNDKLREMSRQRSERNAELRTVIDRVGWVIDGEGTAEDKIARIKEVIKHE